MEGRTAYYNQYVLLGLWSTLSYCVPTPIVLHPYERLVEPQTDGIRMSGKNISKVQKNFYYTSGFKNSH